MNLDMNCVLDYKFVTNYIFSRVYKLRVYLKERKCNQYAI